VAARRTVSSADHDPRAVLSRAFREGRASRREHPEPLGFSKNTPPRQGRHSRGEGPDRDEGSHAEGDGVQHRRLDGGTALLLHRYGFGAAPEREHPSRDSVDRNRYRRPAGRYLGFPSRPAFPGTFCERHQGLLQQFPLRLFIRYVGGGDGAIRADDEALQTGAPPRLSFGGVPVRRILQGAPHHGNQTARRDVERREDVPAPGRNDAGRVRLPGLRPVREQRVRERRAGMRQARGAARIQRHDAGRGDPRERTARAERRSGRNRHHGSLEPLHAVPSVPDGGPRRSDDAEMLDEGFRSSTVSRDAPSTRS
jgi:hypothetical protein